MIIVIEFTYLNSFAQLAPMSPDVDFHSIKPRAFRSHKTVETAAANAYDLTYLRLNLKLQPGTRWIEGSATYYYVLNQAADSITFDLSDSLRVSWLTRKGQIRGYKHQGDKLVCAFGETLGAGTLDSMRIDYHGQPAKGEFSGFFADTHATGLAVYTLSEPYSASIWFPCKESLSDKLDSIDVILKTSAEYIGVSNGILVNKTSSNDTTVCHWKHKYPIATYLIGIAASNYEQVKMVWHESALDSLYIENYIYPQDTHDARLSIEFQAHSNKIFSELFGAYPFKNELYGHAQYGKKGSGMEHQTKTFVGSYEFELLAHELAHQWFGDKITCASWRDLWLNESFATYCTALCYERLFDGYYWPLWKSGALKYITRKPEGSVIAKDTTDERKLFDSRLVYRKGAYVLHTLRWVLGDSAFFKAIYNYVNDPKLSYSFAKTADLQTHFEEVSGQDLTQFFQQWIYSEGYPSYQLDWQTLDKSKLRLNVYQQTSHSSVAFYPLPLEVRLYGKDVNAQNSDTNFVLKHDFSGQQFELKHEFAQLDSVQLDPEMRILRGETKVRRIYPELFYCYPNPADNWLTIVWDTLALAPQKLSILDANARVCSEFALMNLLGVTSINLGTLPSGFYILRLETSNKRYYKKVSVIKD